MDSRDQLPRLVPWAAVATLLISGCASLVPPAPPEPTPLHGPSPERVAIWPVVVGDPGVAGERLLAGLDAAVRARGYAVPSLAVGRELLTDANVGLGADGAPLDAAAVGKALSADAVLVLHAPRFDADERPWDGATWTMSWRLWSTRGHGLLWQYDHDGGWRRQRRDDDDPMARYDDALRTAPIGGGAPVHFRDLTDLVRSLHRLACDHLPIAQR